MAKNIVEIKFSNGLVRAINTPHMPVEIQVYNGKTDLYDLHLIKKNTGVWDATLSCTPVKGTKE